MKAYLSGAIEHSPDGGKKWRNEMATWLKSHMNHDVFNPVAEQLSTLTREEAAHFRHWRESDYPRFKSAVRKLIERDLRAIVEEVDYVICFWDEGALRGGGTHGEVTVACHSGVPVYMVLGVPRGSVSSWILGCTSGEFEDFEGLKKFLEKKYGR
ncbi:MAG: hypothetical protein ACE5GH_01755 [Fidelibacterota bacterium]